MTTPKMLPTLLLVSTNQAKASFFKKNFKATYRVLDEQSCLSLLEWSKTFPIDLIILDYETLDMPIRDFCIELSYSVSNQPPIFLITKILKKSFIQKSLQEGITDFIHEPLDADEIFERIAVHLHHPMLEDKVSSLSCKIRTPILGSSFSQFLDRVLIADKNLQTIIETKKIASPLSVFIVQLDSFAKLNKMLGDKGMLTLSKELEAFLKKRLRQQDFLITEGIGHYLLFLPKTSTRAAKLISEDLRKELARTPLIAEDSEILVTVSFGIISFDKEIATLNEAFSQFESSLEKVKNSLEKNKRNTTLLIS